VQLQTRPIAEISRCFSRIAAARWRHHAQGHGRVL
jgi:hypothetical protein